MAGAFAEQSRAAMAAASASEAGDLSKLSDSDLVHHMQTCTSNSHILSALTCLLRRSSSGEWGASTAVVDEMLNIAQRWTGSSAPLLALKILTNISSSNSYSILLSPDHSSSLLAVFRNGDMIRTQDSDLRRSNFTPARFEVSSWAIRARVSSARDQTRSFPEVFDVLQHKRNTDIVH